MGDPFPQRGLIIFLTFCVILATLVLQSLSLPPLIRWLRVKSDTGHERCEEWEARVQATQAALERIEQLKDKQHADHHVLNSLRTRYEDRISHLRERRHTDKSPGGDDGDGHDDARSLLLAAIDSQRRKVIELRDSDIINDAVLRRIERDLDLEELRLNV